METVVVISFISAIFIVTGFVLAVACCCFAVNKPDEFEGCLQRLKPCLTCCGICPGIHRFLFEVCLEKKQREKQGDNNAGDPKTILTEPGPQPVSRQGTVARLEGSYASNVSMQNVPLLAFSTRR